MIALDHVGVSARFLSEILGLPPATPDGPEGRCAASPSPGRGHCSSAPPTPSRPCTPPSASMRGPLPGVVERLRAKGVAFGNDPEDRANMQTADPLGSGQGRVYFLDPNGHLFEVVA
jgi:catechol 2,3-dioxygenase-like lactoylglutathione lyase family enzyme